MRWIRFPILFCIIFLFPSCSSKNQISAIKTSQPILRLIPKASNTLIIIETPTSFVLPSSSPVEYPQIVIGLPFSALATDNCGGIAIYTMDYDLEEGKVKNYWEKFTEFPKPKNLMFSTRDGRMALDFCTKIGYPITWQLEEGLVTQNRDDGVLDIKITKGIGLGLTLTLGHVNPDLDLIKPGIQKLDVGTLVSFGDLIAYTGRGGIAAGSDASTQTGLLDDKGYISTQELMLIGPDGQPNILYDK